MQHFQKSFKAMGSPCEIQLYSKKDAHPIIKQVIADIHRLEALYSRYQKDSLISAINRVALQGGKIEIDAETASLLNYADTCYQESDGLFDITSGLLRKAWRFDSKSLPDEGEIQTLLDKVGWHHVRWKAPMLEFKRSGMELDFGGIVKEYAADRAAALCMQQGIRHGFVNLGGDIKIIGPNPDGSPWRIGIQHPRKADALLETLLLKQGGLASSGDYQRCLEIEGIRYSHILNPKTGWPVKHLASVSVIAELCVVAGSASTIAMLKEEKGPAWLKKLNLPHLWVDVEGHVGGTCAIAQG